jgi:hypothetical protein
LAPILNESLAPREILSEGLKYHITHNKPLTEQTYRAGSQAYFNLWAEARALYSRGILEIQNQDDLEILTETQLGEFGIYEGKKVPLDFPMLEEQEEITFKKGDTVYDKHTKVKLKVTRIVKDIIYTVPFNFPGRKEERYKKEELTKQSFFQESILKEITTDNLLNEPKTLIIDKETSIKGTYFKPGDIISVQYQFDDDDESFYSIKGYGADEIKILYIPKKEMDNFLKNTSLYLKELKENTDEVVALLNNPKLDDDVKSMLFKAYKDGKLTPQSVKNIVSKLLKEDTSNPTDVIKMDVPLFIRALEYAKEDAKTDMDLHKVTEKAIKLGASGKILNMDDYDMLVGLVKNNLQEEKKNPPLNKPKRGGAKKFYVYVRDPKTKKIKKVSFGMAGGGLRAKLNNPKARQAFAKRHRCGQGEEKTSPKWWSCRIGRYWKSLGGEKNFSGFW